METKLAVLENNLPLKAYLPQQLDDILEDQLSTYLSNLLGLYDKESARRLVNALPAVKEHCWSMGFAEIKKMFEMYVDNKLGIEPMSNYFDRVLLGKIYNAYKLQNRSKVMIKKTDDELKREFDDIQTIMAFDMFLQYNDLPEELYWIYDYLELRGLISYTKKEKLNKYNIAKVNLFGERAIHKSKLMLVKDYFAKLEVKKIHVKDLL